MNYENAADILPEDLLKRVQKFAAGKLIYVPDTIGKRSWGETSGYKRYLAERNQEIKEKFISVSTIEHLSDEYNLEYGVFEKDNLIAVAGGGIDEVHGMRLNNCCAIRFADGKENDKLCKTIFEFVTNDILKKGALPFDDMQHGEYAKAHGNFTSVDAGYRIVNYRYDIIREQH